MEKSAIVVIMQRVHESDVSGVILAEKMGYTHLMIPMEFEGDRSKPTSIGWADWRKDDGELAWPERFTPSVITGMKRDLGPYAYSGQYQQNPQVRGGSIIKDDWWQLWPSAVYPENLEFILGSLDTAYTEKEQNDASALTIWGVFRDAGSAPKVILLYAWEGRLELNNLVVGVHALCSKDERKPEALSEIAGILEIDTVPRFPVNLLLIEAKASGLSVGQELTRLYGQSGAYGVELVNPTRWGDKVARLFSVQHMFSSEMIYAPDRPFARRVKSNVAAAPKTSKWDTPDSVSMGLRYLRDVGLLQRKDEHAQDIADEAAYRPQEKGLYW